MIIYVKLCNEDLSDITPEFKSISQIKKAISIVNTALSKMSYNGRRL
jgi:hypothetical protein